MGGYKGDWGKVLSLCMSESMVEMLFKSIDAGNGYTEAWRVKRRNGRGGLEQRRGGKRRGGAS